MVKHGLKRVFAFPAILILMISVFAAFCGRTSYAFDFDFDSIFGVTSEPKPDPKKTGTYGTYAVLADYDNCLTESEENEILQMMAKAAQTAKCNVGLVIAKDLEGMSDRQYATAFSNEHFGSNSNSVVLLLLNTYNVPQYARYQDWIYASGSKYSTFDTRTTDKVFDRIYRKMGEPRGNKYAYNETTHTYGGYDYYSACKEFTRCVKGYAASGFAAIPNFFLNYITGSFSYFFGGVIITVIITLVIVSSKVHSYKKKATLSASNYMDRNATRVTRQVDIFVREYTTSHTRSSGSHGGGGGGHHGGGGGGGRHR